MEFLFERADFPGVSVEFEVREVVAAVDVDASGTVASISNKTSTARERSPFRSVLAKDEASPDGISKPNFIS